jgi:hypothetical protein
MKIFVDKGDFSGFFISVSLNDKEAISFDHTVKGSRIIKQVLVEEKPFPENAKTTAEWDTIVIENKKFLGIESVRWIDFGKRDWVNNQIWELAWEKPMPEELKGKLQYYSNLICQNYDKLEKFSKEMNDFEKLLSEALVQYTQ